MALIEEPDLWSLIEARADATPARTFLLDEREKTIRFGEFRDRALRVAAGLLEIGLSPGARVSWQLPTWIESAVLVGALARLGAIQNPILPIYREREMRHIIGQVRPRLLVVPSRWRGFDYPAMAEALMADSDGDVLVCDRALPEADPGSLPDPSSAPRDPDEARFILYTSGTTSAAKGALHSDASITAGALGVCTSLRVGKEDRWAIPYPFTHISGIAMLKVLLMSGSSAIFIEQFDDGSPDLMGRLGCTIAAGGTPLVLRYLELQRRQPDRPLFPKLKAAMAGAAPKPPQLHGEVRDEMGGLGVVSCYGSTEVPFLSVSTTEDDDDRLAGSEGRVNPTAEVKISDDEGDPLAPGLACEIRVKGRQVCLGYLDDSLDADAFDDEGFFRTGDLCILDTDGYLTITGRLKDVIIRKGENISAKEIEDVLYGHPAIAEAAVIGLADRERGERCCAVALAAGDSRPTLAEIATFCRNEGLAVQKIPEQLEWLDEFPRNASGKILKFELRERFESSA
jgi:acyl-CoA synthetase (AMP-forming)/AMP-acid ligase II